jgi:hypothetical protein
VIPACDCLNCGRSLDAATGITGAEAPVPGSLSICVYCGAVTIFAGDLSLRPLDEAEAASLTGDVLTMQLLRRATSLIHFYKAARN